MNKYLPYIAAFLAAVCFYGCAPIDVSDRDRNAPLIPPEIAQQGMDHEDQQVYTKQASVADELQKTRVSINTTGQSLASVLSTTLPNLRVQVVDSNVNLSKTVRLYVNDSSLGEYLEYLSEHTGYDYNLDGDQLKVSSVATRQWSLAAFSSARKAVVNVGDTDSDSGGSNGGSNSNSNNSNSNNNNSSNSGSNGNSGTASASTTAAKVTITENQDEWEALITSAKAIIDQAGRQFADDKTAKLAQGDQNAPKAATLMSVRSLGIVQATGAPVVIHRLDHFFKSVSQQSRRQVNLNVQVYQVTLNQSKGAGINWNLLTDKLIQGGQGAIGAAVSTTYGTVLSAANPGGLKLELDAINSNGDKAQAVMNFLAQYGQTSILTQPNITVTNGHTASINNGLKFQVVSSVNSSITGTGIVTNAPTFNQVLVGMEMAVTPRLLDDDSIMIDVVPVVSSLQGLDQFTFSGSSFTQPRIELKQLATQIVTRSGRTAILGGLVTDSLASTLNSLPLQDTISGRMLNWLFSAKSKELNRTELVISITPRLVKS